MVLSQRTTTLPIRIAQLNTQRKKTVITQLLNNLAEEFDILIIQEPSWGRIGSDPCSGIEIHGPTSVRGWNIILPVPSAAGSATRPRTLTYYRPRPDYTITLRTDIIEDRDIQVLDVLQINQNPITIINIYNDTPQKENCILAQLRQVDNIIREHPTIITGDFNMHHPLWSREDRTSTQDQLSEDAVNWLASKGLSILNTKGEITHLARHSGERPSVIDLTFANNTAIAQDTIKDWAVHPQLSLDSDHNTIIFTIDQGREEVENPLDIKYNTKDIQPDDWIKTFEDEMAKEKAALDLLHHAEQPTQEQLDNYAEKITKSIQAALEAASKPRRKSPQSKSWWDDDLKEAAAQVNAARWEQQTYQQTLGEYSPQIQAKICRNRNFFKRLCQFKKRSWINKVLEEASTDDIWKFPNWSKGTRNYPTPPISQGPNLAKATSHHDKCEVLQRELYQTPPELGPQPPPNLTVHAENDLAYEPLTLEEVHEAIHKSRANTAPGHSQVSYQALKWACIRKHGNVR